MKTLIFDLETDGLLNTCKRVHSLVIKDYETKEVISCASNPNYKAISEGLHFLSTADIIVGHNILCFDLPILHKLFDFTPSAKVFDTLTVSRLIYSNMLDLDFRRRTKGMPMHLYGRHSLESWGHRLGVLKGDYGKTTDWKCWTKEMQDYCELDIEVTSQVYEKLLSEKYSEQAIQIEHEFQKIIFEQERFGVPFHVENATKLMDEVKPHLGKLKKELQARVGITIVEEEFTPKVNNATRGYEKGVTIVRRKEKEFNPGSRQQIVKFLTSRYGWNPVDFTEKGNPEVSGEVLGKLPYPEIPLLVDYLDAAKLAGMLYNGKNAWLKLVNNGRIHGSVITNGAVTGRCTHSRPNLSQVPSHSSYKGEESRSLFYAPDGFSFLDSDASGLELRMFAHYLAAYDGGAYADVVLNGDIHMHNQKAAELETRDQAKIFIYACVPMDTKVLTKKGWKTYDKLEEGELVLTFNKSKNVKEWKPLLEKVYYEDAEVIEMSHSQSFKVRTTPNHRWFVKQRLQAGSRKSFVRRYYDHCVKTTEEINSESHIIVNAPMTPDNESTFSFVQDKYNTNWEEKVLEMSSVERQAFLQGFLLADGYWCKPTETKKGSGKWTQNVGTIADGLLLASFLETSGNIYVSEKDGTNKKMWQVVISNKPHVTGQKLRKVKLENQPVFCIRTENESFVMKQGNCITITGNTLYGAGDEKMGSIKDPTTNSRHQEILGSELRRKFYAQIPAIKILTEQVQQAASRGWLRSLDGRKLPVHSKHVALNVLLQGGGAVVCKQWNIETLRLIDQRIPHKKVAHQVMSIHDEIAMLVRNGYEDEVGMCCKDAMKIVTEKFNMKIPLAAEYKVGKNWAETH